MKLSIMKFGMKKPEYDPHSVYPVLRLFYRGPFEKHGTVLDLTFHGLVCTIAGHKWKTWEPTHKASGFSRCCSRCQKWQSKGTR